MQANALAALIIVCVFASSSARASEAVTHYLGMCDASAAAEVGRGYFAVADDEQNILNVYKIGEEKPVASVDLTSYLGIAKSDGTAEETDIEGAARIGDRIYWISSHGANSKGKPQPSRRRLFVTSVDEKPGVPQLRPGKAPPYTALVEEISAHPGLASVFGDSASRPPESSDGMGIEGLAATPAGGLLIGFRNPRPQNKALVLPLENPSNVIDSGAKPAFGKLIQLDLGGRGIRSLEWTGNTYMIVAGPHNDTGDFMLYTWSGPGSTPKEQPTQKVFTSLHPEALFRVAAEARLYTLSDDGDIEVDGKKCKKLPQGRRSFRGAYLQ